MRNSTGVVYSGNISSSSSGNTASCSVSLAIPLSDDKYSIDFKINDSENYETTSDSKTLYVCNSLSSQYCNKADFDQDLATEGIYTSLYGALQTCDMCLGQVNLGTDYNANGIDTVCDPSEQALQPQQPKGGGGGGAPPIIPLIKKILEVSPNHIMIKTTINENVSEKITVTNRKETPILVNIDLKMLGSIKTHPISDLFSFMLASGQSKELEINFNTSEVGTYVSKIIISGDNTIEEIPVTLIVEKKERPAPAVPFSIDIHLTNDEINRLFKIDARIFNVSIAPAEGFVKYQIIDSEGRIIWEGSEPITIKEETLTKEIILPDLAKGDYTASVEVSYEGNAIINTKNFTISGYNPLKKIFTILVLIVLSLIAIYVILRLVLLRRKLKVTPTQP
jgi:hypothetical protein